MKKLNLFITALLISVLSVPCTVTPHAEEPGVERVSTIEDYIDATTAGTDTYFSVDKKTGSVDGKSFESFFGKEFDEESADNLKETIEEDSLYAVTGENRKSLDVVSIFGTKRIKVRKVINSLEGAETGASYGGNTILQFKTAEDTKAAYEKLIKKYGQNNVLLDLPVVKTETAGWGTAYMNLDDEEKRVKDNNIGNTVTVAVIDTGVNKNHAVFKDTVFSEYSKNITSGSSDYSDDSSDDKGHGTAVAGIIAESTPENVEIMALKVLGQDSTGSIEDTNQAILYASDKGADVINLSLGGPMSGYLDLIAEVYPGINPQVYLNNLEEDLNTARQKNVIICAASGNYGKDLDETLFYPAYSRHTIAVGAINNQGVRSEFSNYGDSLDFCAPGYELKVASNMRNTMYKLDSGTSYATPYISSCCAYIKMQNPEATLFDVREELKKISIDRGAEGKDKFYGWGMPKFEDLEEEQTEPIDNSDDNINDHNNSDTAEERAAKEAAAKKAARANQKGKDGTALGAGASAEAAEKAILSSTSEEGPKGSEFGSLALKSTKQGKNNIQLAWKKVKNAKSYVVYGNECGKKSKMKKLAVAKSNKFNVRKISKKLRKGKYHKFMVVALDKNNNVISASKVIHVATKGGKIGNHKSVKVSKKVVANAKKLKKGKSLKLKAKAVVQSKNLKVKKHRAISYETSNAKIATVSRNGVVKAKNNGTCYIYAYAQNGAFRKIKVIIK